MFRTTGAIRWPGGEAYPRGVGRTWGCASHEEFLLAEGGTLPDRQSRLTRARITGARAWLQHLAAALQAEWPETPPDFQSLTARWLSDGAERLEALELEEQAVVEREGLAGDPQMDARRVTLPSFKKDIALKIKCARSSNSTTR